MYIYLQNIHVNNYIECSDNKFQSPRTITQYVDIFMKI